MNSVWLCGRLARDPEIFNGDKTKIASFTLAVDRPWNREQTDWIRCKAFNKTADMVDEFCGKGKQVNVMGYIQTGSYEKKDGTKVYTTDVVVDRLELLGGRQEGDPHPYDRVNKGVPAPVATLPEDIPEGFHAYSEADESFIPF